MTINNRVVDGEARLRVYYTPHKPIEHGDDGAAKLARLADTLLMACPYIIGVTVRWGGICDVEVAIPADRSLLCLFTLGAELQRRADALR